MNAIDNDLLKFNRCDIFTPDKISLIMNSFLTKKGNLLEPAVGTGNLLKFINYNDYTNIDIYDIKQEYLDECDNDTNIKKYNTDFIKSDITTSYKNIILNPPYIRFQDLSIDYRKFIFSKIILNNTN